MHHENATSPPIPLERALTGLLALLVSDREARATATTPRAETILARAGLSVADIACLTGRDRTEVRATLERDARPSSVIDRARAHMARNAAA